MPTHLLLKGAMLQNNGHAPGALTQHLADALGTGATIVEIDEQHLLPELLAQLVAKRVGVVVTWAAQNLTDFFSLPDRLSTIRARALNIQLPAGFEDTDKMIDHARTCISHAEVAGVSVCFETIGSGLEDLHQVERLLNAVPEMRLTLNVQHLLNSQLRGNPPDSNIMLAEFATVLSRTEMIRCNAPADELTAVYAAIWERAMRQWRQRHSAGSAMIALCEPGEEHAWQIASQAWKSSARPTA